MLLCSNINAKRCILACFVFFKPHHTISVSLAASMIGFMCSSMMNIADIELHNSHMKRGYFAVRLPNYASAFLGGKTNTNALQSPKRQFSID